VSGSKACAALRNMSFNHFHTHSHSHAEHSHRDPTRSASRLRIALALTAVVLIAEVVASFVTGSLALLSDAGHMATDVAALAIALLAIRLGSRPADAQRSYGYRRFEILAAAMNAAGLFAVAAYVFWNALQRFQSPVPINTRGMLVVATLGLVVNALAMFWLRGESKHSLNVRGAYLEVLSDFLGSVAVLIGAILIQLTGAVWIDSLLAILIALWVMPRGWSLLKSALHVLLEGTPEGINAEAVRHSMQRVSGVRSVHDLHIWSLTTGVPLLTAHVELEDMAYWPETLGALQELLANDYHIEHVTLQAETTAECAAGCVEG
jgi:cobalt-zinc-cadmium efflux system protein